ncbi:MAG TPA: hypothetical protein VGQ11_10640 [Candidatus Acidoferrales bacterium]|nr:hypothetical protein [Candidatus Acidoferrales bacterium]
MIRKLILLLSILAGTVTLLVVVFLLHFVAVRIEKIQMPLVRAGAVVTTLVLGVLLLVGATYFSTHLIVRLFRSSPNSSNPQS